MAVAYWRSPTSKLNPPSAFVYFRLSWSCYSGLGLGLKNLVLFTSLVVTPESRQRPQYTYKECALIEDGDRQPYWFVAVVIADINHIITSGFTERIQRLELRGRTVIRLTDALVNPQQTSQRQHQQRTTISTRLAQLLHGLMNSLHTRCD